MKAWELMVVLAKCPCNAEVRVDVPYAADYVEIISTYNEDGDLILVTNAVEIAADEDTEDEN